jgi:DNA-binding response OmpR family regulator
MSEEFVKEPNCYLYIGEILVETGVLHDLENYLCYPGGTVFHTTSSTEARAIVENNNIVAIVVDQYLPFCSGLELMRWLQRFAYIPTIIIGKRKSQDEDTETVVALEAGAADAVDADISARELAARVKACTRKYLHAASEPSIGTYVPDAGMGRRTAKMPLYFAPECRRLYFSDTTRAVLHAKEAELMTLLINKHPAFIDREEISQNIFHVTWNPNDRRIDNLISKLRKIVDATHSEGGDSIIETVRNEGYRLRSPIALIAGSNNMNYVRNHADSMPRRIRD